MKPLLVYTIAFLLPFAARGVELSEAETKLLLTRIAAVRAGCAMTANYDEKKLLPMMKAPLLERGTIAFEPPAKFLRRSSDGNLAVSDGTTLWMYYPAFQQAEKYPLAARGPGAVFSMLSKVFQLEDLPRHFVVVASKEGDEYRLVLVPRSGGLREFVSEITVRLDKNLHLKASRIIGREGDEMETTYSMEKTVPMGTVSFAFSPPVGTTVVSPLGD